MISKKLSLNKVCIILATTILLLSVVMFSVLYILTKEMSVVFCSMAFCLLFLLCVTVFVILIRRKLTLFSEILCCTLDEMMNGKIDISQVVLTSIITRRKELAMLQSIGMTGKQLKKMLSFEGLYYAAGTVVASIVFGSLVSVIIVRAISNSIWFFTYKFVIFPMFVIYPFLIALTVIIPAIIYRKIAKTSIIERLRSVYKELHPDHETGAADNK